MTRLSPKDNPEYLQLFISLVEKERLIVADKMYRKENKIEKETVSDYTFQELMLELESKANKIYSDLEKTKKEIKKKPSKVLTENKKKLEKKLTNEYNKFNGKIKLLERDELVDTYKTSNKSKQGRSRRLKLHNKHRSKEFLTYLFMISDWLDLTAKKTKNITIQDIFFCFNYAIHFLENQKKLAKWMYKDKKKPMLKRFWESIYFPPEGRKMDNKEMKLLDGFMGSMAFGKMKVEIVPFLFESALSAIRFPEIEQAAMKSIGIIPGFDYYKNLKKET